MRVRIRDIVTRDVSDAARRLRKQPIVLLLMVTSLGVGVGVNITLYSVVHHVLSADWLQAREPDQLVTVKPGLSYANLQDLRAAATALDVAGFQAASLVWAHERGTRTLSAHVVSDNYFRVIDVRPLLGRTFDQDAANVNQVVLSYRFWQARYGGSVAALGQTLTLNGWPMTVVGVLPADFYSTIGPLVSPAVYVPISAHVSLALDNRGAAQFDVLGRLKPGGTFVAAARELGAIDRRMRKDHAVDRRTPPLAARSGAGNPFDSEDSSVPGLLVRGVVSAVHGLGILILLIACANVAGVLAARADERSRDLAIRAALGAGRGRLAIELFAEGLVLGVLSVSGAALVWWFGSRTLVTMPLLGEQAFVRVPTGLPIVFCILLILLIATASTIVPMLSAGQAQPLDSVRSTARGPRHGLTALRLVVGLQIAICTVFVGGAIFALRLWLTLGASPPVYDSTHVIVVNMRVGSTSGRETQDAESAIARLSGVTAVSYGELPSVFARTFGRVQLAGVSGEEALSVQALDVEPTYLSTLGVPMILGRNLITADLRRDDRDSPIPVVVTRRLTRQLPARTEPLGMRLILEGNRESGVPDRRVVVVGVAADTRLGGRESDPQALIFVPAQAPPRRVSFVVHTSGSAKTGVAPLTRILTNRFPGASLTVTTADDRNAGMLRPVRIAAMVLGVLAIAGTLVAMVGLHGLVSYLATRRVFEVGVRMALGAPRTAIAAMVVHDASGSVLAGIGLALLGGAALDRLLPVMVQSEHLLSGANLVLSISVVSAAASLACSAPALRATRVDPVVALRRE